MNRKTWAFLCSSLAGVGVGIAADFVLSSEPVRASYIPAACVLSPVLVTVGGKAVTVKWATDWFLLGGISFIPVYAVLMWVCIRRPWIWVYPAAFLWCCQGYFQLLHRLGMVMSA